MGGRAAASDTSDFRHRVDDAAGAGVLVLCSGGGSAPAWLSQPRYGGQTPRAADARPTDSGRPRFRGLERLTAAVSGQRPAVRAARMSQTMAATVRATRARAASSRRTAAAFLLTGVAYLLRALVELGGS